MESGPNTYTADGFDGHLTLEQCLARFTSAHMQKFLAARHDLLSADVTRFVGTKDFGCSGGKIYCRDGRSRPSFAAT